MVTLYLSKTDGSLQSWGQDTEPLISPEGRTIMCLKGRMAARRGHGTAHVRRRSFATRIRDKQTFYEAYGFFSDHQ